MREIKFRAWSNKYNQMFRVNEICMTRDGYIHGTVDAGFKDEYHPTTDKEWESPLAWIGRVDFVKSSDGRTSGLFQNPNDEPFILMQYTGVKDHNGTMIFEGDIIKYSFRDGEDINTRVLEIFNDGVNFKMREIYRDFWLEKVNGVLKVAHGHLSKYKNETQYFMDIQVLEIYSYEVIGNIYEHKHLLEETA